MAWIDVKKSGEKHIYRITTESYEQTFKDQGYIIVDRASESVTKAQSDEGVGETKSTPNEPKKRKYTRRKGNTEQ